MKKKLASSGFQSPNYTQTPNDFFQLIGDMEETELKVTLVMIRSTFGFHRNSFKMGIKKIAKATGLSLNGARAGAEAAEERGTFRRTNADAQGEAEWELVVENAIEEWGAASEGEGVQPLNPTRSTIALQSPIKESIKERINKNTTTTTPTAEAIAKTTNAFTLYEQNIGPLTPLISQHITGLISDYTEVWVNRAIQEAAFSNVRKIKYISEICAGYKERGSPDIGRTKVKTERKQATPQTNNQAELERMAQDAYQRLR